MLVVTETEASCDGPDAQRERESESRDGDWRVDLERSS